MKRIVLILFVTSALTGCEFFPDVRNAILQKANTTVENIGYQLETTKMGVQRKVDQVGSAVKKVEDAAQKVKDAADAVKKVGE